MFTSICFVGDHALFILFVFICILVSNMISTSDDVFDGATRWVPLVKQELLTFQSTHIYPWS